MTTICSPSNDWLFAGRRIRVLVGHYGSGKTELAVNMALALAQKARAYHDNYGSEKTADVMWGLLQKKFPFLKEIEIQKNNEA